MGIVPISQNRIINVFLILKQIHNGEKGQWLFKVMRILLQTLSKI
ncbi:hypothetical protein ADICYQ_0966 [Cyclobacterium qasimii M12-11B]|uniref:Uncharacterized protein n=1 Tax=Cyclobacterium qasimii M12-11B TaxID=641524 RepID=S7VM81_9BACT|nr:hypothetical protein ADICYQ_0966 [Cyclobacterium qasimii M12-11B]